MHGGLNVMVIRKGRRRKSGRRHPNGELIAGPKIDYRALAAMQPHRREVTTKDENGNPNSLNEKAGTPLGNLLLNRTLTAEQYEAGRLYSVDCGAYFASIGVPTGLGGGGKGYGCAGAINCENCECRRRKNEYDAAYEALVDAGQRCARAVAHIAVHGKDLMRGEMSPLLRGLDALVLHYGLTNGRKSSNSRNTH